MLDLPMNKVHSGLGYHSQPPNVKKIPNAMEGQVLLLPEDLGDGKICAMEVEEDGKVENVGLVYQRLEGQELTKWTSTKIPEVTMFEK